MQPDGWYFIPTLAPNATCVVFASNSWEALGFLWTLVMVVTFETDDDHSIKQEQTSISN